MSGTVLYALYAIIHLVLIDRNVGQRESSIVTIAPLLFQSPRVLINPEPKWGPLLEQNRKKVAYYHGGHEGALVSMLARLKNRALSRQTLTGSAVSDSHYRSVQGDYLRKSVLRSL